MMKKSTILIIVFLAFQGSFLTSETCGQWVWESSIGETRIAYAYWNSTKANFSDIINTDRIIVGIKNVANTTAGFGAYTSTSSGHIAIYPSNQITSSIGYQDIKNVTFRIVSLGVYDALNGTVTIKVEDRWGHLDDQVTLTYRLLVGLITVRVLDKETSEELLGISIT